MNNFAYLLEDDSLIIQSPQTKTVIIVADSSTKRRGGSRRGIPNKHPKQRTTSDIKHYVKTLDEFYYAVLDILWRLPERKWLTAKEIISYIDESSPVNRAQLYRVLETYAKDANFAYKCEYKANSATTSRRWDYFRAADTRKGWYWRGRLWSERELVKHPSCKVKKTALHNRLHVQGMTVEEAMTTARQDNTINVR